MHDSLTPEIKFFLDSQTVVDNKILLKGWVVHLEDGAKNLKFLYASKENDTLSSRETLCNNFHEREDVKEVYSDLPSSKIGFETEIPYTDVTDKIWITLNEMPVVEILIEKKRKR